MERMFTCIVKKEGELWSSLCIELDVASCGNTKEEAIEGLKCAIETYIEHMVKEGREKEIERPVPSYALSEFLIREEKKDELHPFGAVGVEVACA